MNNQNYSNAGYNQDYVNVQDNQLRQTCKQRYCSCKCITISTIVGILIFVLGAVISVGLMFVMQSNDGCKQVVPVCGTASPSDGGWFNSNKNFTFGFQYH